MELIVRIWAVGKVGHKSGVVEGVGSRERTMGPHRWMAAGNVF